MKHTNIRHSEFAILSGEENCNSNELISHLLHLAAHELEPHEPDFANKFSEIHREQKEGNELDWNSWYNNKMQDSLGDEVQRMMNKLGDMKNILNKITRKNVLRYCHDMLITDSFIGEEAKKGIIKKLAMENKALYLISPEESSLDGYIGDCPIVIKPYIRNLDYMIDELTQVHTVYYKLHDDDIELIYELDESA